MDKSVCLWQFFCFYQLLFLQICSSTVFLIFTVTFIKLRSLVVRQISFSWTSSWIQVKLNMLLGMTLTEPHSGPPPWSRGQTGPAWRRTTCRFQSDSASWQRSSCWVSWTHQMNVCGTSDCFIPRRMSLLSCLNVPRGSFTVRWPGGRKLNVFNHQFLVSGNWWRTHGRLLPRVSLYNTVKH